MSNVKEQGTNNQSSSKALRVWIGLDIDASENEKIEDLAQRYFKNTNQNPDYVYWLPIIKTQSENGFLYRTSQNKELTKADAEGFVYFYELPGVVPGAHGTQTVHTHTHSVRTQCITS